MQDPDPAADSEASRAPPQFFEKLRAPRLRRREGLEVCRLLTLAPRERAPECLVLPAENLELHEQSFTTRLTGASAPMLVALALAAFRPMAAGAHRFFSPHHVFTIHAPTSPFLRTLLLL